MMRTGAVVLETERLTLEPLREADAAEMVGVLADESLYRFTGGTAPNLAELQQRYRSQLAGPSSGDEVWCNWIIRERDGARAVGYVQATINDDSAEAAWVVARDFQGLGFGTEAARALCDWLRSSGARRLVAHIHPEHVASQRIAEAVGLGRTGEVDEDGEEIWASPRPG